MDRGRLSGAGACLRRAVFCLAAIAAFHGPAAAQQQPPTQGPDTLSETYSAWTVRCQTTGEDKTRSCTMTQVLQRDPGGDRLLLVELSIAGDKTTTMVMLTPFGLNVAAGANLQTDEDAPRAIPFFTCLPNGCLLRQTLAEADLAALRRGNTLTTSFTVAQGGEPFVLKVSLEGFSAAYRRLLELAA